MWIEKVITCYKKYYVYCMNVQTTISVLVIRAETLTVCHLTHSAVWGTSWQFQNYIHCFIIMLSILFCVYAITGILFITFMVGCESWLCSNFLFVCHVAFAVGLKCFLISTLTLHITCQGFIHVFICCISISSYMCEVWSNRTDLFRYEAV